MGVQPDQQQSLSFVMRTYTLAAGVAQQIASANGGRGYFMVQNTGVNPATIAPNAVPTAAAGVGLDAASAAGGQGGSYECIEVVPTNPFFAISAAGTTLVVCEG